MVKNEEIDVDSEILKGKIFIYPTDTIYGIGCDATNEIAVKKIKQIKSRDGDKPLSVIAPSFEWIENNFIVNLDVKKYLPGPYTLLLKKKDINFLKWISLNDRVGVRIPTNDFTKKIQKSNLPFVTTSVNFSGEPFAISLNDIKKEIRDQVDYLIEGENLSGKPSILIIDGLEIKR
jgi:L-threonylcarbamoyladenylate synthase